MSKETIVLIITVIGTLVTTVSGIIVSNHKLKNQLIEDVKVPIKEVKKEVSEYKTTIEHFDNKLQNLEDKFTSIHEEMKSTSKLTNRALLSILRHKLTESGHKYIKLGYIVDDELEAFIQEYNSYTELGGNHYVTALYNKVMELPVRSVDEETTRHKTQKRRKTDTLKETLEA